MREMGCPRERDDVRERGWGRDECQRKGTLERRVTRVRWAVSGGDGLCERKEGVSCDSKERHVSGVCCGAVRLVQERVVERTSSFRRNRDAQYEVQKTEGQTERGIDAETKGTSTYERNEISKTTTSLLSFCVGV